MDYGEDMEHGGIVTHVPPPYPYMSMMATGPGLARVMPLLPWRSVEAVQQAHYAALEATFVAREAGTYWYSLPDAATCRTGHVRQVRGAVNAGLLGNFPRLFHWAFPLGNGGRGIPGTLTATGVARRATGFGAEV